MALVSEASDSDAALVERVLAGDRHAFAEMLRRHDHRLRGVAYKLLGGDPHRLDDVMQEAYVKAYRSLHRFRHDAELGTWLYRVVYNACVDDLRRARHRPEPVDVGLLGRDRPTTEPGPERVIDAADQARRALAALPEEQRATVVLVDGEGFDNVTAADHGSSSRHRRISAVAGARLHASHPRGGAAMTPEAERDPVVSQALRRIPVPDHAEGFWTRLDQRLAEVTPGDRSDHAGTDPRPAPNEARTGMRAALPGGRRNRGGAVRLLAVAALVAAALASVGLLRGRDGDVRRVETAAPPATPAPTTSVPVSDSPTGSPETTVTTWLDALGNGDVELAASLTGPRTVAYLDALGQDVEEYLVVAAEGYGSWASSPDRGTTEIDLATIDGTPVTVVVVTGTRTAEGTTEVRTDALPVVQADGAWLVEPVAFDPDVGGRIEISSPPPSAQGGLGSLAPDGVVEVAAPGDGTFFFSLEDGEVAEVPGVAEDGAVRARWDPPGELGAHRQLLVVAYVDGDILTAVAGTVAVER